MLAAFASPYQRLALSIHHVGYLCWDCNYWSAKVKVLLIAVSVASNVAWSGSNQRQLTLMWDELNTDCVEAVDDLATLKIAWTKTNV